jgi:hypothetical protein
MRANNLCTQVIVEDCENEDMSDCNIKGRILKKSSKELLEFARS